LVVAQAPAHGFKVRKGRKYIPMIHWATEISDKHNAKQNKNITDKDTQRNTKKTKKTQTSNNQT